MTADAEFVSDVDPRRWGFINSEGAFVPVPKTPLLLGGYQPPVTVETAFGPRTVVVEPEAPEVPA